LDERLVLCGDTAFGRVSPESMEKTASSAVRAP
jgi:hypothetical protein